METRRTEDMKAEDMLAKYMDKYFYERLHQRKAAAFERFTDKKNQLDGMDVRLTINNKTYVIDEKASMYYCNLNLPTFSFEIDSLQRDKGNPVIGWFVNDRLKTDYYMLIWPNVVCEKKPSYSEYVRKTVKEIDRIYDFTPMEAMLIEKNALREDLSRVDCDRNRLLYYAKLMRKIADSGTLDNDSGFERTDNAVKKTVNDEINIQLSLAVPEKPVNVVIKKKRLLSLAEAVFLISQDGYAQISV